MTPGGYETVFDGPLFEGACEYCWGDGSYLHPLGPRVTCLRCHGFGSDKAWDAERAERERLMKRYRGFVGKFRKFWDMWTFKEDRAWYL